jgi:hypothetical protein
MKLQEECGVTSISLENAIQLLEAYGTPRRIDLSDDPEDGNIVTVYWPNAFHFKFTGFSWGYGGTGPHGLDQFFQMCGIVCGMETIMSWPQKGFSKTIDV